MFWPIELHPVGYYGQSFIPMKYLCRFSHSYLTFAFEYPTQI